MNAVAADKRSASFDPHMSAPIAFSVLFHAAIVILSIVGLPYVVKDYPLVDNSIAVEIVDIDKITQTDRAPTPKTPTPAEQPKAQPREMPPEQTSPTPPQAPTVTAKEPPKPVAPERPAPEEVAPPQKQEEAPPVKERPAPPKPQKRPAPVKAEEKPTAEDQEQFNSLLRNLMKTEPQAVAEETEGQGAQNAPQATLGQRLTMSEIDAVRFQLGQCWKLMAGARYAETLVVEIKMTINPDRTVKEARIVDQIRYSQDSFFRAAADSAYRAVFQPDCNPLKLPPEKYNEWKTMTVRFDPREML